MIDWCNGEAAGLHGTGGGVVHRRGASLRQPALAIFALLLLASLWSPGTAHALHCPKGLITRGDPEAMVRARCGAPLTIEQRNSYITRRLTDPRTGSFVEHTDVVPITVWIYNFGRNRLMQELEFRSGRLSDTRSLGYGY